MGIMDEIHDSHDPDDLKRVLIGTSASPGPMPTDDEIRDHVLVDDYYGSSTTGSQLGAIFRGLERKLAGPAANPLPYGNKEADMSVEHVFPQSCATPPHGKWADDLRSWSVNGDDLAFRVNRLGNLTLLTNQANKFVKTKKFDLKQKVLKGTEPACPHPVLLVSKTINDATQWGPEEIDRRTEWIASECLATWVFPTF